MPTICKLLLVEKFLAIEKFFTYVFFQAKVKNINQIPGEYTVVI